MITFIIPKLPFIDKQKTIGFYNRLGFNVGADYTDYLIMNDARTELHFFSHPTLEASKSDFMIYLRVDADIEALYQTFQQKGIVIHPNGKLEDKLWKQREFAIIDPNGTLLTFGQAI
jgi:uncharacterized glyoxalase superfamily protein PhnB